VTVQAIQKACDQVAVKKTQLNLDELACRFAEMQNLWKNDKFLKASSKRKPQSFHRIFARLHMSHERCTAAYRERSVTCV
jgi:hypothetical protein